MSKERLTIDEIIEHCKRRVSWYERIRSREFLEDENNSIKAAGMEEYWKHRQVAEYLEELKQYRDLEEQGLLLRLPCKVGDTVYSFSFGEVFCAEIVEIKYICEAENYGKFVRQKITIDGEECGITIIDFSDIGKRYFLTQSEAEEKLRELEGK